MREEELMDSAESGEGLGGRPHRAEERRDLVKDLQASAKRKVRLDALGASGKGGPAPSANAARSQDFLYDEFGLPEGEGDFAATDIIPALPKA
jgi:hypothetical protein